MEFCACSPRLAFTVRETEPLGLVLVSVCGGATGAGLIRTHGCKINLSAATALLPPPRDGWCCIFSFPGHCEDLRQNAFFFSLLSV